MSSRSPSVGDWEWVLERGVLSFVIRVEILIGGGENDKRPFGAYWVGGHFTVVTRGRAKQRDGGGTGRSGENLHPKG